ncbi:hypothetical protein [Streptomyces sp. DSM 15324]|uniref:hypothetical protein n=1 Tax=Streptomyces sp. DSM 15324 TaxID=1739111 RepID=UPI00099E95EF|nr:hypothetical protein [Streptomyces sp. DSM 15324]
MNENSRTSRQRRCAVCDLIVGMGCPGCGTGTARALSRGAPAAAGREAWRRFPPGALLISRTGYAHLPGCTHLIEDLVKAPEWGWIPEPAAGLWDRASAAHPVPATEGNTRLSAVRRCTECQSWLTDRV